MKKEIPSQAIDWLHRMNSARFRKCQINWFIYNCYVFGTSKFELDFVRKRRDYLEAVLREMREEYYILVVEYPYLDALKAP